MATENFDMDYSKYDFKDSTEMYVHLSKKGLSKDTVIGISKMKDEPQWMLDFRLRSYEAFMKRPMPNWGADLSHIDFQNIYYYAKASEKTEKNWDDVPEDVKNIHLTNLVFLKQKRNSSLELVHNTNLK